MCSPGILLLTGVLCNLSPYVWITLAFTCMFDEFMVRARVCVCQKYLSWLWWCVIASPLIFLSLVLTVREFNQEVNYLELIASHGIHTFPRRMPTVAFLLSFSLMVSVSHRNTKVVHSVCDVLPAGRCIIIVHTDIMYSGTCILSISTHT